MYYDEEVHEFVTMREAIKRNGDFEGMYVGKPT